MANQSTRTLFLAAGVLAAGLFAWILSRDSTEAPSAAPEARDVPDVVPRGGRTRETPPDFDAPPPTAPPPAGSDDAVPRILPPDAAIEDIRDALARRGKERMAALQQAFADTVRLARGSARGVRALERQIDAVDDARVLGIATAALGATRTEQSRRRLRLALRDGVHDEARLGALIALARPPDLPDGAPDTRPYANAERLGSLAYPYAALPEEARLLAALARFLDDVDGVGLRDALPIITASVKASAVHATLLAAGGKKACRWYRTLASEDRDALRAHALEHASLLPEVRRVLTETK